MNNPDTLPPHHRASYADLARLFLRLSVIAFGGPVAHLALAEDEIVTKRGWITREHFLNLVAAVNLIPGPNSTEVMIHIGYIMRGIPGAIFAGLCFIVPSLILTLGLTALYITGGSLAFVTSIFWGLKPVIIAIIAAAGVRLMPSALKNRTLQLLFALAVAALVFLGVSEVVVMLSTGLIYALIKGFEKRRPPPLSAALVGLISRDVLNRMALRFSLWSDPIAQSAVQTAALVTPTVADLFWYFLKIGSILFGSGYVLFAYIQNDLVNTFRWLTAQQLLDAIAIGQFTPGPVSTAAGSIGFMIAGPAGAFASAIAIFLPAFILVILSAPYIEGLRKSVLFSGFLDGINAGVLAAILIVVIELARAALTPLAGGIESGLGFSLMGALLGIAAFVALWRFKINATWLLLVGGLVGLLIGFTAS